MARGSEAPSEAKQIVRLLTMKPSDQRRAEYLSERLAPLSASLPVVSVGMHGHLAAKVSAIAKIESSDTI